MATQTYADHSRKVPAYGLLLLVAAGSLIGACVNLYESWGDHQRLYSAALLVVAWAALLYVSFIVRGWPLRVQDRAIHAEENLRHFALTGKLLDPRLTARQVVALRFASDAEFPGLARRAADEKLEPRAIKQAVKSWRSDEIPRV